MLKAVPDAPLPLNCPKCPRPMAYITSPRTAIYLYRCADHGEWQLGPGGLLRPRRDNDPPIQPDVAL